MSNSVIFDIQKYSFKKDGFKLFSNNHYSNSLWPVVYLLSDDKSKEIYIGETADIYTRMETHLKDKDKSKLSCLHVITCDKFNKSATLDIESNLIKYIAGDGIYKLMNGNIGLANHNYFQKKEVYWDIFKGIWNKLEIEGITKHSLEYIGNTNLFKYSPYKSLNSDQRKSLITIMENLLNVGIKTTFVEGGAGTGKSVLAVFLFKLLTTDLSDINLKEFGDDEIKFIDTLYKLKERYPKPKMALVVPMAPFRETLKKVFRKIKGLRADMVVGPSDITDEKFDIIVVDEGHRLRRRNILGSYYGTFDGISDKLGLDKDKNTELDWVLQQGKKLVLFYDENQSVRPSDIDAADFIKLKSQNSTCLQELKSQLRNKGGVDYVEYIHKLLNCSFKTGDKIFGSKKYSFLLFDSLEDMVNAIKVRDRENGLSRLIAGYSWEWVSKGNKSLYDINIGKISLRWNSVTKDWINSTNAINEVGCIHTSQGYDLNYAGIVLGREISYDEKKKEIVILKENYYDKNGKAGIKESEVLKNFIINIYNTLLKRGINGTYVYACDEALKRYLTQYIPMASIGCKLQMEAADDENGKETLVSNAVPLYDLKAAAGGFSSEQQVKDPVKWIQLPDDIRATDDMFACQVVGESMNKKIPNGAICLFKWYESGSRDGKIVLVQHTNIQDNDYGNGFTVKEYRSKKYVGEGEWHHGSITLNPLSYDSSYQPIVIQPDKLSELKVKGIFERVLYESVSDNL